ncbi:MAG: heme exporter protein CcmD [Bauldia sp.]|nr:heme exporter protein CcmD [Bauldia sp.]
MELGDHAGYIIAGYLITFVVIVGAIWLSWSKGRQVRARLEELDARGIRRRSDPRNAAAGSVEPRPGT